MRFDTHCDHVGDRRSSLLSPWLKPCGIFTDVALFRLSESLPPLLTSAFAEICTARSISLSRRQASRINLALPAIASIFSCLMLVIAAPDICRVIGIAVSCFRNDDGPIHAFARVAISRLSSTSVVLPSSLLKRHWHLASAPLMPWQSAVQSYLPASQSPQALSGKRLPRLSTRDLCPLHARGRK